MCPTQSQWPGHKFHRNLLFKRKLDLLLTPLWGFQGSTLELRLMSAAKMKSSWSSNGHLLTPLLDFPLCFLIYPTGPLTCYPLVALLDYLVVNFLENIKVSMSLVQFTLNLLFTTCINKIYHGSMSFHVHINDHIEKWNERKQKRIHFQACIIKCPIMQLFNIFKMQPGKTAVKHLKKKWTGNEWVVEELVIGPVLWVDK